MTEDERLAVLRQFEEENNESEEEEEDDDDEADAGNDNEEINEYEGLSDGSNDSESESDDTNVENDKESKNLEPESETTSGSNGALGDTNIAASVRGTNDNADDDEDDEDAGQASRPSKKRQMSVLLDGDDLAEGEPTQGDAMLTIAIAIASSAGTEIVERTNDKKKSKREKDRESGKPRNSEFRRMLEEEDRRHLNEKVSITFVICGWYNLNLGLTSMLFCVVLCRVVLFCVVLFRGALVEIEICAGGHGSRRRGRRRQTSRTRGFRFRWKVFE